MVDSEPVLYRGCWVKYVTAFDLGYYAVPDGQCDRYVCPDGSLSATCHCGWYKTVEEVRAAIDRYATECGKQSVTVEVAGRKLLIEITTID